MKVMILALILLLAIFLSASSASLVAGTRVDKQTKSGVLIPVYFDTVTGPSRSIPLTNTAQTPPRHRAFHQLSGAYGILY